MLLTHQDLRHQILKQINSYRSSKNLTTNFQGQDEVFDVSMIFDPVCDIMLNFTKCIYATELIDRSVMVPILQVLPQELLSYCQSQGIFTGGK